VLERRGGYVVRAALPAPFYMRGSEAADDEERMRRERSLQA
jgi:hypothetical protein